MRFFSLVALVLIDVESPTRCRLRRVVQAPLQVRQSIVELYLHKHGP